MMAMSEDNSESLSLEAAERIDDICTRFEKCWKSTATPLLEQYLARGTASDRRPLLRELLWIDIHYRSLRGKPPTVEEYLRLFPDQEEVIRSVLSTTTGSVEVEHDREEPDLPAGLDAPPSLNSSSGADTVMDQQPKRW